MNQLKKLPIFAYKETNHVGDKAIICENTADMISKIQELIQEKTYLNTL